MDAGFPSQERLVEKIFELNLENPYNFEEGKIEEFRKFLSETMCIPEALHNKVPLEDIFTPLDRCLAENVSYRNLNVTDIKVKRELIYYLIGTALKKLELKSDRNYVDLFAKHIVEESSKRSNGNYRKIDNVSVISLNWDILLDNAIKNRIHLNYEGRAVVDYCCYISSFDEFDKSIIPGLEMLGLGGFNVKLLKLHGSLNWLQCPKCHRLYIKFHEKIGIGVTENCRHCDLLYGELISQKLSTNLIMPTMLKDLSNPQYKIIWQNAGIEIAEAKKIIFIGYSLPQADFEMRQLLSRMVRDEAEIEVVDFGESENDKNILELKRKYSIFFGNRFKNFVYWKGTRNYIIEELTK